VALWQKYFATECKEFILNVLSGKRSFRRSLLIVIRHWTLLIASFYNSATDEILKEATFLSTLPIGLTTI
jgi:uncharacterized membrane protein